MPGFMAKVKGMISSKRPSEPRPSDTNKVADPVPKVSSEVKDRESRSPSTSPGKTPPPPPPTTPSPVPSILITQPERKEMPLGKSRLASVLHSPLVHATIASFLNIRQLFATTVLGRDWRDVFWLHCVRIELSSLAHRLSDSHLDRILKRVPGVHAVSVAKCRLLTNAGLKRLSGLPELDELNLEGCGNNLTEFKVLGSCVKLKKLNLSGCQRVDDNAIQDIVSVCHHLDELGLNGLQGVGDTTLKLICQMKKLRWLRLNGTNIQAKGVPFLCNLGERLLGCQLGYCSSLTDGVLADLLVACPNIVQLLLYGCTSLTDASLTRLAQAKHLVQLDLSMCRHITDDGIHALVGRSSCLESLNIYDCVKLTDVALQNIADSCLKLKYLGAFGLPQITDLGVIYVLEHAKGLRRVEFGGCPGIKTETRRTTMLPAPAPAQSKPRALTVPENDSTNLPPISPSILPLTSSPWPSAPSLAANVPAFSPASTPAKSSQTSPGR